MHFTLLAYFGIWKKTGDNLESLAGGLTQITTNTNPLEKNIDDLNNGLNLLISNFLFTLKNLKIISSCSLFVGLKKIDLIV